MQKIKFLFRALRALNLTNLLNTARQVARANKRLTMGVFFDIIWCGLRYGAGHTDYRTMNFINKPARQRATFVTRGVNNGYIRKLNQRTSYHKLENKITFNTLFNDYVGREWLDLNDADIATFTAFVQKHPAIIVKPVDKLCGQGIEKHQINSDTDIAGLYYALNTVGQTLVEECITQHAALNGLYAPSVNTLRLVTVRTDDKVHIVFSVFRIGLGGSVIDNTDAGGLCAFPNEAGVLTTEGINYKGDIFPNHPDTGVAFKGFVLPLFHEAQVLVKKAAMITPELRYIGWDVAFTEDRPILIEANHNPAHSSFQTIAFMDATENGKRPIFDKIFENIR